MKKALIFDLDGTLWDSSVEVMKSWNEVIVKRLGQDYAITSKDIQSGMGLAIPELGRKVFPTLPHEEMLDLLKQCMENENIYLSLHPGKLYPYVEKTLCLLKKDYSLFIVSNCQKGYIEAFLKGTGLGRYFEDHLCWGDTFASKDINIKAIAKKHGIDRLAYVGDIQKDEEATRKTPYKFIHAAYGFGKSLAPDGVINRFDELLTVAKGLL